VKSQRFDYWCTKMACGATLKRSHEFDALHSPGRSPKRMCGELISSPKPQCPNYSHPASFVEAAHKFANGEKNWLMLYVGLACNTTRMTVCRTTLNTSTDPNSTANCNPIPNPTESYHNAKTFMLWQKNLLFYR